VSTTSESNDAPNPPELNDAQLRELAQAHAATLVRAYMRKATLLWQKLDRTSTWLTAAGGASIGVAITQLAVIRERLGLSGSRALLWVLAASVLAGLIEKYLGFSVGIGVALANANEAITRKFNADNAQVLVQIEKLGPPRTVEKYLAPFVVAGIKEMRPAVPAPLRFLFALAVRQGLAAPRKKTEQGQLRWLLWQLLAIHVQFALMVAAVIIAAFAA